jgi:hypothetical protein
MTGDDVEVYFQAGEWRVGVPTGEDPISRHDTQDEAVEAGRAEAQRRGVELVVRDEKATITDREQRGGRAEQPSD